MKIICVLGNDTRTIVNNLRDTYASIDIVHDYTTLRETVHELKSTPVKVDKVLIMEDALDDQLMQSLISLSDMLNGRFFVAKELIFLLHTNSKSLEYVKHVFDSETSLKVTIKQQESYNFQNITYILGGKDALEQNTPDIEHKTVVRRKIGASQTITLMANEGDSSKGAIVYDDIDQVAEMFQKLEAQKSLLDITNIQVSVDAVNPKTEGLPESTELPIQNIDEDFNRSKKEPKLIVVSGERGSGKTTTSYALAKSYYANGHNVLMIDLSQYNMGLSNLIEVMKEQINVMFLHELISSDNDLTTKAMISKFSTIPKEGNVLNALALSTRTKLLLQEQNIDIDDEEVLASIIEIILSKIRNIFDVVILDLPLAKYSQYSFIFNTCDYLLLTFHKSRSSAISLALFLLEKRLHTQWYKMIFLPTDVYRDVSGIPVDEVGELQDTLDILMKHDVVMTAPVRLSGLHLGAELAIVVDKLIATLPSKKAVNQYYEQLSKYTNEIEQQTLEVIDTRLENSFVNPFTPSESVATEDVNTYMDTTPQIPDEQIVLPEMFINNDSLLGETEDEDILPEIDELDSEEDMPEIPDDMFRDIDEVEPLYEIDSLPELGDEEDLFGTTDIEVDELPEIIELD